MRGGMPRLQPRLFKGINKFHTGIQVLDYPPTSPLLYDIGPVKTRACNKAPRKGGSASRIAPQSPGAEMPEIADINDTELWTVRTTLRERYGEDREIELQIADSDTASTSSEKSAAESTPRS